MKELKTLPGIIHHCMTIGNLPTSYKISLTYEEQLMWFCKFLQDEVIPVVNNNSQVVQELKTYVEEYFDNLDVQEEVNTKLEAMAEDGTLEALINDEILQDIKDDIDDIEESIGNVDNLTSNDKTSIVNAINNSNSSQKLNLGMSLTYDIDSNDDIGHVQGACTNGNMLYVVAQGGTIYPNGYVYVFNILTNEYVTRYEVPNIYHANDMTYLNGKLYIARAEDHQVVEYNPATGESQVINPFSTYSSYKIAGISQLNGKLVGWLCIDGHQMADDKFVMLEADNVTTTELTFADPYKIVDFITGTIVRQQFDIDEEHNQVYFLAQQPNILIEATLINGIITLQKSYEMPTENYTSNLIGETEAVSVIKNDAFPKGSLFITARQFKTYQNTNNQYGKDTIQNYIVNPKTSIARFGSNTNGYHIAQENHFNYLTVKKTNVSNLLELGSAAYPFKDLIRAMNCVKTLNNGSEVVIRDSGTYYIPFLYGYNVRITTDNNCTPTIYLGDIVNCTLNFEPSSVGGKITIRPINDNKRITIRQSTINLNGTSSNAIEIVDTQILLSQSYMSTRRTKFTLTANVSSGYCIQVFDGSYLLDQITYETTGDKYINYSNGSLLITDKGGTANVVKSGGGALVNIT